MTAPNQENPVQDALEIRAKGKSATLAYIAEHCTPFASPATIRIIKAILQAEKDNEAPLFEANALKKLWETYLLVSANILDDESRELAASGAFQPAYDEYLAKEKLLNDMITQIEGIEDFALFDKRSKALKGQIAQHGKKQMDDKRTGEKGLPGNKESKAECREAHQATVARINRVINDRIKAQHAGVSTED